MNRNRGREGCPKSLMLRPRAIMAGSIPHDHNAPLLSYRAFCLLHSRLFSLRVWNRPGQAAIRGAQLLQSELVL